MARNESLPAVIQQAIEYLTDKSTPEHIRFNYYTTLKNIRQGCDDAIKKYENSEPRRR